MDELKTLEEVLQEEHASTILVKFYEAEKETPWDVPNTLQDISKYLAGQLGICQNRIQNTILDLCRHNMIEDCGVPFMDSAPYNMKLTDRGRKYVFSGVY